ncbi:MAG: DUF4389 domain-containing protein [Chloroflexi bacterium]|nr:MAG: DUF4389 domain-containing protein [Chloroflexota bacterium]
MPAGDVRLSSQCSRVVDACHRADDESRRWLSAVRDGSPRRSRSTHRRLPRDIESGPVTAEGFLRLVVCGYPTRILILRFIAVYIIFIIAFFAVLFTGNYPEGMHKFVVDTYRWQTRVNLYMNLMTDEYPPFSGE